MFAMKKAFTLVELLVVVVVLVTLMTMVFRLSNVGDSAQRRNATVSAMQRIENCISGYYAAFGSYPPVKVHGSRSIYYKTNRYGIQQVENDEKEEGDLRWERVEAACRSQPVAMNFPFASSMDDYIETTARELMELHNSGDDDSPYKKNKALENMTANFNPGWISGDRRSSADWTQCQVFRFGLMSYLLPRFIVMMGNNRGEIYSDFAQWKDNNQLPCRFEDGAPYTSWQELNNDVITSMSGDENAERWKVEALPSQAVTARWMPNLKGLLHCEKGITIYGVNVAGNWWRNFSVENANPTIYSGGDSQGGEDSGDGSTQYVLDGVTVRDGWYNELYYYSEPPFQSYRLWSAGANGKTFPPWISEEEIQRDSTLNRNRKTIMNWKGDDIMHLTN